MSKIIHFSFNRGKFEVHTWKVWADNLTKSKVERDILGPKDEL